VARQEQLGAHVRGSALQQAGGQNNQVYVQHTAHSTNHLQAGGQRQACMKLSSKQHTTPSWQYKTQRSSQQKQQGSKQEW
jgi:hypothetical protein